MRSIVKAFALAMVALAGLIACPSALRADPINVKLELSLCIDVSGSVDANEYNLQKTGYVNAFHSAAIKTLVGNTTGGIAVNFIQWSQSNQQQMSVQWTHLTDAASCDAFANAIAAVGRPFSGNTAPGDAINFSYNGGGSGAAGDIFHNNFISDRQVIDVSGDGAQNNGFNTATARDNALAAGVDMINGLSIGNEAGLEAWYNANIKGGINAFVIHADSFDDFGNAIQLKLAQEIQEVPVPAGVLMAGIGIVCVAGYRRFSRKPVTA